MKKMCLDRYIGYAMIVREDRFPHNKFTKRLPTMKLAIRIFALSVAIAGLAAAYGSSATTRVFASHQSATAADPVPLCAPGLPGCPNTP
jgi:hypothetical protein